MKRKRGLTIKIKLSNRWLYTLIFLGILIIVAVGVYAFGTSDPSTFGHSIGEIQACSEGEILQVSDGSWTCSSAGGDTRCDTSGTCSQVCIGSNCKTSWHVSGGLYGWCEFVQYNCRNVKSPMTCSLQTGCVCPSGYSKVGNTCYKN